MKIQGCDQFMVTFKRALATALAATCLAVSPTPACHAGTPPSRQLEVLSPVFVVDKPYRSMLGPQHRQTVQLDAAHPGELLWLRGYRTTIVGADGHTPASPDLMCHNDLDLQKARTHCRRMGDRMTWGNRLFTASPGQFEVQLPPGFGIPVMSDEPLAVDTQVLNLNGARHAVIRHKVSIAYVRDGETGSPLKPLFQVGAWGQVSLDKPAAFNEPTSHDCCSLGAGVEGAPPQRDAFGHAFAAHWVVKPGRQVTRTVVTKQMRLPYDTTVHFIGAHVHAFAESLELLDVTDHRSIYRCHASNRKDRIGLSHIDTWSSVAGMPLYKNHEYELITTYHNTSSKNQDAMAALYLYCLDKEFHPTLQKH
jgi:hypothetical protein